MELAYINKRKLEINRVPKIILWAGYDKIYSLIISTCKKCKATIVTAVDNAMNEITNIVYLTSLLFSL